MSHPIRTIVAGVRTLAETDTTLVTALALGERTGADVHLVHAFEFPRLFTLEPGAQIMYPDAATDMAADLTARLETVARALPGGERASCRAEPGSPGELIRQTAARTGAELVLVGAAGGSRLERAILGTTAQRVLRDASVPVLVLREPFGDPTRILLTTDLTELSGRVHERALDLIEMISPSERPEVRSLLVLAFDLTPPPLSVTALQQTAAAELDAYLQERRPRGIELTPVVRTGQAAAEIVAEAGTWPADLLVVGTHARHGLERLMLGSVAEACLRDAACNVLAIPPLVREEAVEGAASPGRATAALS